MKLESAVPDDSLISQAAFFEPAGLITMSIVGLIGVWLSTKTGFPDPLDSRISQLQRFDIPTLIGLATGRLFLVTDVITGVCFYNSPISVINPNRYIQHNLAAADGLQGFGELISQLPPNSAKVNTVRVFQDGDYILAHTDYNFFDPKIGFDIFRFEDGQIVEHWDDLQETAGPNPSGHTMVDGPTQATDLDKTEQNKAFVRQFVDDILVNGRMDKLVGYFYGDNYTQHNPQIGDGLSGLGAALQALAAQGITMKYDQIHRVLGEGNFVLVVSEGSFGGQHTSFYDLFRVENGKIAEHWDTIETIPAREDWKNDNGKF